MAKCSKVTHFTLAFLLGIVSPHQNKKALNPLYHKNIFDRNWGTTSKEIMKR